MNKTRCELALKSLVEKQDWNSSKGMAKPKSEELVELNSYLEKVRGKIASHYRSLDLDDNIITAEILKNAYLGIGVEKINYTLLSLTEQHNTMMEKVIKYGTLKNYFSTSKYLKNFLKKKYNASDIYLKDLKYEFITAFESNNRQIFLWLLKICMHEYEKIRCIRNRRCKRSWL